MPAPDDDTEISTDRPAASCGGEHQNVDLYFSSLNDEYIYEIYGMETFVIEMSFGCVSSLDDSYFLNSYR